MVNSGRNGRFAQLASFWPGDRQPQIRGHLVPTACVCILIALMAAGILIGVIPSITLLTLFLGSATAMFVLFRAGENYDVLHPVRVFGAVWTFCLALSTLHLITFTSEWSTEMWVCVLTALVAFVGGFWLMSQHLQRRWRSWESRLTYQMPKTEIFRTKRTLVLAAVCLLIGILAMGYQDWQIGAIPILAPNIDEARTMFVATASQWSHAEFDTLPNKFVILFGIYCKYAAILATVVLAQRTQKTKTQKIIAVVVILLALLALASVGGRGFIVEYSVPAVALFHYLRRRVRLKEIAATGLSLLLFLTIAGYVRGVISNRDYTDDRAKRISNLPPGPIGDSAAFSVYTLTCSLEVFSRLMQDAPALRQHSSGFLFYSLHRFVPRSNIQELTYRLYTMEAITPTFLGEFYLDYGALGVFVGPLILGALFGYVYSRAIRFNSSYWLAMQGIFLALLLYLPYVNLFSQNVNWIWDMISLAWLVRVAKAPGKERTSAAPGPRTAPQIQTSFGRVGYHT